MTCEAFDAVLPDYLEGSLDASMHASVERHLGECLRCAGLVRDLEKISKDAAALPDLVPARDLWSGIEARIAAPVIPLAAPAERQHRFGPAWMGIAAAALIVSTAGVTYLLTARSFGRGGDGRLAQSTIPVPQVQPADASASGATPAPESQVVAGARNSVGQSVTAPVQSPADVGRPGVPASLASRNVQSDQSHSEAVYGKEIEMLQNIVSQRRTQLDPSTVAIIERNLQIIDAAINQSRAALAKDPASMLLSQQLTHALDKKVELLRTAAMLPAST
jgi:anti-sigma factor RsiW